MATPDSSQSESAFRITRERTVPVVIYRTEVEVLYEGDDWLEAEETYHRSVMGARGRDASDQRTRFHGTHPSHRIEGGKCAECGAPDNGCYAIHLPCGYPMGGRSMATIKAEERAARDAA